MRHGEFIWSFSGGMRAACYTVYLSRPGCAAGAVLSNTAAAAGSAPSWTSSFKGVDGAAHRRSCLVRPCVDNTGMLSVACGH